MGEKLISKLVIVIKMFVAMTVIRNPLLIFRYGCDLAFTPMIISDSFVKSIKARDCEFTTNAGIEYSYKIYPVLLLFAFWLLAF